MIIKNISIIGLGAIGGSMAKTIRRILPDIRITAYDTNKETIEKALEQGVITEGFYNLNSNLTNSDLIFLSTPVSSNNAYLKHIKSFINSNVILTDMGSVKSNIHKEIINNDLEDIFIGGHPMAGLEKSGYDFSSDRMFENIYYLLTPSSKVSLEKINVFISFLETLQAIPTIMDYNDHDYITATVSHLPHLIAFSLVNLVKKRDRLGFMKKFAAGGFKDITRIASSSPNMWQQIFSLNKDEISVALNEYIEHLTKFNDAISNNNYKMINEFINTSKEYRDSIPASSLGIIKKTYKLYCDVVDEAGSIAKVVTLLSDNNVSIKNIGIENSREFSGGVLKIEIYHEQEYNRAIDILERNNYKINNRD